MTVPPANQLTPHSNFQPNFSTKPGESNQVRLEVDHDSWKEIGKATVNYPGWDASFRVPKWDATKSIPYRVRHGERAEFTGMIRPDPAKKSEISGSDVVFIAPGRRSFDQWPEASDLLFLAGVKLSPY